MLQVLNKITDGLTDAIASLTILVILVMAVFWIAAREVVILVASVTLWALCATALLAMAIGLTIAWQLARRRYSLLRRDRILADVEAESARVDLAAKIAAVPLLLDQLASGRAIPSGLAGITSSPYPLPIVKHFENLLPESELPALVRIEDYVRPDNVSLNRLVLGVAANNEVIRGSLRELSHVGIAGTSRWGKSIFLQVLLYQILLAREKTELYLSDIGGTSFIDLGRPYADDVASTERLAGQLWEATMERKAKYQGTGQGVRSLDMFNSLTGEDLPSIIFAADETTVLMGQSKALTKHLMNLVSYAGKYGIFLLLAGQNWKSVSVPSEIRDQFSSRFQFKSMDHRQASILIPGSEAQDITTKGRAAAWIPEVGKTIQIQTPFIEPATLQSIAQPGHALLGDKLPVWDIEPEPETPTPREQIVLDLWGEGASMNKISKEINEGRTGGTYNTEIKSILEKFGNS